METIPEHCYVRASLIHADGLVVDTTTGEIAGYDRKPSVHATPYDYTFPEENPFRRRVAQADGFHLDPVDTPSMATGETSETLELPAGESLQRDAKRGPKPKVFVNLLAQHIQVAYAENHAWLDDYVFGACSVVGGVSNGKLNVSPSDVRRVCMLERISTEGVQAIIRNHDFKPVSPQQARRLAQVARFALDGMSLYLQRNPETMKFLAFEVDFASSYVSPQSFEEAG
jgi:hypothetical protein